MSLRCGLFDSTEIVQTVDGYPQGDKAETADFFAHYFSGVMGNGVPTDPSDSFKVTATGSMVVNVAPGYCYILGYHAWDEETASITIPSGAEARSVYVSMRLNLINGEITLVSDTAFTRAQSIYDLALARIDIPVNTAAVTDAMITDLRDNKNYCGRVQKLTDETAEQIYSAMTFSNIVSPGGEMTGALTMNNNVSVNSKLSDGTTANLIGRNNSNNIWIGTADDGAMQKQGDIFLATSADGNAYVSRNDVRGKILDYGFVGKQLWEGTWSSGSITVPNTSQYKLFMIYTQTTAGAAMATPILGMKYSNSWIRGPGGYNSASALYISTVAVTLSGNTWTLSQVVSDNLGSGAKTDIVITDIYGLI